jgi:hypothetical protein
MLEASIGLDVDKRSATGWQRPKKSMELVPPLLLERKW